MARYGFCRGEDVEDDRDLHPELRGSRLGVGLTVRPARGYGGIDQFAGGIGRSDFSNSDGRALLEGIRGRLLTQADDAVVLPGHGPRSTIGRERTSNPFL